MEKGIDGLFSFPIKIIKSLETRHGLKVGCPEEIAWRNKWIDDEKLIKIAKPLLKSGYGEYLLKLPEEISLKF